MIYLDTSALIKLYLLEDGSETVHGLVTGQDDPLPVWELQEMELVNALRLKVFWKEISKGDADRQIGIFGERKTRGLYFFPEIERVALFEEFLSLTRYTPSLGCRTLDIMHVACARVLSPDSFVSFDARQRALAGKAGLNVLPRSIS